MQVNNSVPVFFMVWGAASRVPYKVSSLNAMLIVVYGYHGFTREYICALILGVMHVIFGGLPGWLHFDSVESELGKSD